MKQIKDIEIEDLLAEGRKWVAIPGEQIEGGFRLLIVFEDHPYRFVLGSKSNDPLMPPPFVISSDDPDEWCQSWAIGNGLVDSDHEYLSVIASSIRAHNTLSEITVTENECGLYTLTDGFGNSINCEDEQATRVYQRLAAQLGLPYQKNCHKCGDPLMDYEVCPCDVASQ